MVSASMTIVRTRGRMPVSRRVSGRSRQTTCTGRLNYAGRNGESSRLDTQSEEYVIVSRRGRSAVQAGFRSLLESGECSEGNRLSTSARAASPRELYYRISLQVYG